MIPAIQPLTTLKNPFACYRVSTEFMDQDKAVKEKVTVLFCVFGESGEAWAVKYLGL